MTCAESTFVRRFVGFIPFAIIGGIIFAVMDDMDTAIPFFIIGGIGLIVVTLSGRGDKDVEEVQNYLDKNVKD